MEIVLVCTTAMLLMRVTGSYCYSNLNLFLITYVALFQRLHLVPIVVCNHFATISLWYGSWLLDPSIPTRMIQKFNWSVAQFVFGDLIMHSLPTILVVRWVKFYRIPIDLYQLNLFKNCGLYSAMIHLLWGYTLSPSFDISDMYIPLSRALCNSLWVVLLISHMLTMNILWFIVK